MRPGGYSIMISSRGVTLIELLVVVSIITLLLMALGFEYRGWQGNYKVESQVKEFHADLMNARARAMQRNRLHFLTVASGSYQIAEDTNENGGTAPDAGDTNLWPSAKPLQYPSLWAGTIVIDRRGLASPDTVIRFSVGDNTPDNDCIIVSQTRINLGQWAGGVCNAK